MVFRSVRFFTGAPVFHASKGGSSVPTGFSGGATTADTCRCRCARRDCRARDARDLLCKAGGAALSDADGLVSEINLCGAPQGSGPCTGAPLIIACPIAQTRTPHLQSHGLAASWGPITHQLGNISLPAGEMP